MLSFFSFVSGIHIWKTVNVSACLLAVLHTTLQFLQAQHKILVCLKGMNGSYRRVKKWFMVLLGALMPMGSNLESTD